MTTIPAHTHPIRRERTVGLVGRKSERVMHTSRICRDCRSGYRYADYPDTHHNPRYCPTCLPHHPRYCATCRQAFHPARDTDRLCPIHLVHPDLFGKDIL